MRHSIWYPFGRPRTRHLLYEYLLVPLLLLAAGFLIEHNLLFGRFNQRHIARIQSTLTYKERLMDNILQDAGRHIDSLYAYRDPFALHEKWQPTLEAEGMTVQVCRYGKPVYWSDNSVTFPDDGLEAGETAFLRLPDGWYVAHRLTTGEYDLTGLIRIRHVYALQNRFLSNDFHPDFGLPASVKISTQPVDDSTPFYDAGGRYLFSLVFTGAYPYQIYIPVVLYLAGILILIYFFCHKIPFSLRHKWKRIYLIFCTLSILIVKYVCQVHHFPRVFYELELFNPELFASSQLFPSLGDLLLWSAILVFIAQMLYTHLSFSEAAYRRRHIRLMIPAGIAVTALCFHFVRRLIQSIVMNSSIFGLNTSPIVIHPTSIIAYTIILLQFVIFLLVLDKMLKFCARIVTFKQFLIYAAATLCAVGLLMGLAGTPPTLTELAVLTGTMLYCGSIRLRRREHYRYLDIIIVVFVFSVFTTFYIVHYANVKHAGEMEQQAVMLSMRQDPVAEFLLMNIHGRLAEDPALDSLMYRALLRDDDEDDELKRYLSDTYFSSYWQRYDLQALLCRDDDEILVWPDNVRNNCVDMFTDMVRTQGVPVQGDDIWYIEDPAAAGASYLMWLPAECDGVHVNLFLKLDAVAFNDKTGYPQLLLDGRTYNTPTPKGYSYAIYHRQELVQHQGDYEYNLSSKAYDAAAASSGLVYDKPYRHYVYRNRAPFTIVVTRHQYTLIHCIIFFSCILLTFFSLLSVGFASLFLARRRARPAWNFRNKIQFAMVGLLTVVIGAVYIGTVTYLVNQLRAKDRESLNERLQAVYSELLNITGGDTELYLTGGADGTNSRLNAVLVSLSNVFYTDIHVFRPDGRLAGTSRSEVFSNGLSGACINPAAFRALIYQDQRSFVQEEHIGGLEYSSGYITWQDENRQPAALLNLLYFGEREALIDRVTELSAAALNVSVLALIFAIVLAMIISRTITQPLRMIQEKISQVSIDNVNNKITSYQTDDEIGSLVKAYNRVVDELTANIQKLARSEREAVWREMAKQVSHEINNPLTPMKLSIQHLQRAWVNQSDKFNGYMETIPKMLVEQIDLLSSIAQEFSSYAKMPSAYNQPMDIVDTVRNAITLYGNDRVTIRFDNRHGYEKVIIYADKEQMLRVFSNLFKNAAQAVPAGRKPLILVDMVQRDNWVYIRVKDNGSGIPPEMQARIFKPEFTTKSKGMGLGLAIVKNTVESAGGSIGFRTRQGLGTSFTMRLPLWTGDETAGA